MRIPFQVWEVLVINLKIPKLKKKSAPKVKIDVVNMTMNIKNGMQVSFDQKKWYTIFPYSNTGAYLRPYFYDDLNSYDEVDNHTTCFKISSISLSDTTIQKYLGKDIYVRTLGKNNLPSEIATVHLPNVMSNAPKLDIVNSNGKSIVQNIIKGANDTVSNPEYEYCIGEDEEYISSIGDRGSTYDVSYKWKKLKIGTALNNKLSTKYSYKVYKDNGSDDGPVKKTTKTYSKTVYLLGKKGEENPVLDIYIRRKGDKSSGTLPSEAIHYKVSNQEKD